MQRLYCAGITLSLAILLSACGGGSNVSSPATDVFFYRGDRDAVLRYLGDVLESNPVQRFSGRPRLRIGEDFAFAHYIEIGGVVNALNWILPVENEILYENQFQYRESDPNERATAEKRAGPGEILLRAIECTYCTAGYTIFREDLADPGEAAATFGVEVWIPKHYLDPEHPCDGRSGFFPCSLSKTALHELLHALGLRGHAGNDFDSVLSPDGSKWGVGRADHEGLAALYTLKNGDSVTDLGPWEVKNVIIEERYDLVLIGEGLSGQDLAFGARTRRSGQIESYLEAPLVPSPVPAELVTGRVTWEGALFGLTPDYRAVSGEARLQINLADSMGRADFTDLEIWDNAPGTPGTGTLWGGGDLGYSVSISQNSFSRTGGNEGRLYGRLIGNEHEGMGGEIQREDLVAGFGGIRLQE